MDENQLKLFFLELVSLAKVVSLRGFRRDTQVMNKADGNQFDPVTRIDKDLETLLIENISAKFPEHGIWGEEYGIRKGSSKWTWIIDPIDGTRSYISGLPTWGTLIGLLYEGKPCFGVMSQPFVGDCFFGSNKGSVLIRPEEERPLFVRDYRQLAESTLCSTTPDMFTSDQEISGFNRLSKKVNLVRFGADSYGYCLLAAGCIDLVVEANLEFYDIAPLIPIIENAGGFVSDWSGAPVRSGGRVVAASSKRLAEEALQLL